MSRLIAALHAASSFCPERRRIDEPDLERALNGLRGFATRVAGLRPRGSDAVVRHAARHDAELRSSDDGGLAAVARRTRAELRERRLGPESVGHAFALIREIAARRLGERHFDVQLAGGWILLQGMVAEMATGEGKTLTATLAAGTAALAGIPVHVVTVNDYLARRDAEWMRPVYEALGLTVGHVVHELDRAARRRAYRCDVTYCTNKELVFDYLRDRLELGPRPGEVRRRVERLIRPGGDADALRLRGLCYGIVDEADSVLIDEARTPLIISGPGDTTYATGLYRQALALGEQLTAGQDYRVDVAERSITLTDAGIARLAELARPFGGFWSGRLRREDLVRKALTARQLFHRDTHYVVRENQVQIVDEYTGRVLPGRSWEGGLHQLIEAKESCAPSARTEVLARISYQRFFRRYLCLAGMTGTAREAAPELWSVYRLRVVRVPTHRPVVRRVLPESIFRTSDEKWRAVVERIRDLHAQGRPVLIGTRTVADSELLARRMAEAGLEFRVLNALQDEREAEIVAQAGVAGQITVATNMAGRGTDIKLGPGVREAGGLHVIATVRHDARRIDRQLFGRCGRQGDPGSCEAFVSLEDDLLREHPARALGAIGRRSIEPRRPAGRWLARRLFSRTQRAAESRNHRIRRALLKLDESLDSTLAFSGSGE